MNDVTKTTSRRAGLSRRGILKTAAVLLAAGLIPPALGQLSPAWAAAGTRGGKILIVYYSRSGNTREMAGLLRQRTGGDILELHPVDPYPAEYKATTEQAKRELESGYMPPLQPISVDVAAYDVIFVGSPSWWARLAPPVQSFLSSSDLSGKTLIPFVTHLGSGMGNNAADLRALCPNSTVLEGLALRGRSVDEQGNAVDAWLRQLEIIR